MYWSVVYFYMDTKIKNLITTYWEQNSTLEELTITSSKVLFKNPCSICASQKPHIKVPGFLKCQMPRSLNDVSGSSGCFSKPLNTGPFEAWGTQAALHRLWIYLVWNRKLGMWDSHWFVSASYQIRWCWTKITA